MIFSNRLPVTMSESWICRSRAKGSEIFQFPRLTKTKVAEETREGREVGGRRDASRERKEKTHEDRPGVDG